MTRTPCKNLVYLYLGPWGSSSDADKNKYIPKFKQAPNLTYLHLDGVKFTITTMEKMFGAAPNLKTLACSDVIFAKEVLADSTKK